MHIPDGFLDPGVAAAAGVVAAGAVGIGLRRAEATFDERRAPLLGVTAAFVFAAQMLNFPVAGGTSGHLLGAALAVVLLGPWLACLVLAVVLGVQALLFADGGLTALGANVLNLGVVGAFTAALVLGLAARLLPPTDRTLLGAAAAAAWISVVAASAAVAVELAISGTVPLGTALPAMVGVHMLIGVGEAVITVAALSAVLVSRPDLVRMRTAPA